DAPARLRRSADRSRGPPVVAQGPAPRRCSTGRRSSAWKLQNVIKPDCCTATRERGRPGRFVAAGRPRYQNRISRAWGDSNPVSLFIVGGPWKAVQGRRGTGAWPSIEPGEGRTPTWVAKGVL